MGMYSTYDNQEIEILNKEELIKLSKDEINYNLIDSDGEVDFAEWCGHKIEGYWYDESVTFLKKLARHIKGFVEFQFEEGYNFRIVFKEGKVYRQRQPEIDWSKAPQKEL